MFSLQGEDTPQRRDSADSAGAAPNSRSSFYMLRGFLPQFFSSEWSLAQFRVSEPRSIAAFAPGQNGLIGAACRCACLTRAVVTASGLVYRCSFDPSTGGECTVESKQSFAQQGDHTMEAAS